MRRLTCIVTLCFMILSIFSGCSVLQKIGLQKSDSDEIYPASSISMGEDEAKKLSDKVPIRLYFANEDSTKLKLEVRYIPVSEAKKSVNNLAGIVVKELINGPEGSDLKPTIPKGTKLRSSVGIKAGVATVDLSKDFVDKHPGGKAAEQLTIYSVVNSLTQIKDILKVKFLINGESREAYKGSFKFDIPFPPDPSLISNDTVLPSPSSTIDKSEGSKDKPKLDNSGTDKDNTVKSSPDKTSDLGDESDASSPSFNDEGYEDSEATYEDILE